MSNGLKINRGMAIMIIVIGILSLIGIILACAVPPSQVIKPPVSQWGDNYFYAYEPPEKAVGSVKVTMAIVNPYFSEKLAGGIYGKVARGFSKSMAIDLDKIIVAKGMTVTGPFESLDMMTYPDKKNADLTLTPEIFINVQSRDITDWEMKGSDWFIKTVEVKVDAWVVLMMREPLSSEKIWIKKIGVGEMAESAEIWAQVMDMGPRPEYPYIRKYGPGRYLYDGTKDAVANIIKKMYPNIMQTTWRYLDTQEILVLKEKAEEIKKLKRY